MRRDELRPVTGELPAQGAARGVTLTGEAFGDVSSPRGERHGRFAFLRLNGLRKTDLRSRAEDEKSEISCILSHCMLY